MSRKFLVIAGLALSLSVATSSRAQDSDVSGINGNDALEAADERIGRMESVLSQVFELRDQSQDVDQDLTRVRCINDKVAAIQGFLRLSTDSRERLQDHVTRGDQEGIEHQYTLILIASQRVSTLDTEASQCAGDILTFAGDTEQQVTIDPSIPDEDLTELDRARAELERFEPYAPLTEATPFQ